MGDKIVINDVCMGCGACVVIAPKTFTLNASKKSEVINQNGDAKENIERAIRNCPVVAIKII